MAELKLHDLELSGNCYKVRLLCALLGLHLDVVPVDFLAGAHKKSPLIEKNPFGEVPIFEDGGMTLRDSQAILVYLARKYGGDAWLPTDAAAMAKVVEWLMSPRTRSRAGRTTQGSTTSLASPSMPRRRARKPSEFSD
jgi:glutathione S-transferase